MFMEEKMAKKGLIVLVLAVVIAGGVFSQEEHKHQPFDVLLGLNFGLGITPNIGDVLSISEDKIPQGNYALVFDFGVTGDFYLFNWLSFNTGLLLHPDIYVLLDRDLRGVDDFTDIAASPLCLTIPLAAHVNIPNVEWLYMGIGLNLNFPITGMFDSFADVDTKGDFFVGLPIDIGFDFIQPNRGGGRFFFRVTPEIHKHGTAIPVGFVWQIYNWKVYGKNNGSSGAENTARSDVKTEKTEKAEKPTKKAEAEKPAKQAEAEKKPADTKAASAAAEADNARQRRAALDAYNAAKSKFEKAETNKAETEARLAAAKEAVSTAEADLAKAAAALSALESR